MMSTLFFYGTLMVPEILQRVIGRPGSSDSLVCFDAVLDQYTRHHVNQAAKVGATVLGRKLVDDEDSVRGVVVDGLTQEDVEFLDEFEGDEYERRTVTVQVMSTGETKTAGIYIWIAPLSRLSPSLWSFADFMRDKAHRWVGSGGDEEYLEVDRRRAMQGVITPNAADEDERKLPEFGKEMRKNWTFADGWVNLNHGSYGAPPKQVIDAMRAIQDCSFAAPDQFIKVDYMSELATLRGRLAELVGCDTDDLVVVTNATTGVNTALKAINPLLEKNDKFLYFASTIYDACGRSLQYVIDSNPHLSLSGAPVQIAYPISHADVIAAAKKTIEEEEAKGSKIRFALVDAISSVPGVIVPWEELVQLFKKHDIISIVDAAHQIGQLPVNLAESQPDFWAANCHKWLLAARGCAALYGAKNHSYEQRKPSPSGDAHWISEFEWFGTIDYSPLLSTAAALDFRAWCGGEKRITSYCHALALEGGEYVAKALGTEVMRNKEGDGELVANMVNVRLPIPLPSKEMPEERRKKILTEQFTFLKLRQLEDYKIHCPCYIHNDTWWVRLSAQIYTDLDDFKYAADVLKTLCKKVVDGEYALPSKEERVVQGEPEFPESM
ncbi:aminotransferase, class V/Cysteine desulfurase [Pseudohyphozyma bogoriensis]|nr:aminotransferase, class V/Cysteine desulfurase [Pseudohyphozyma bogoriensis]